MSYKWKKSEYFDTNNACVCARVWMCKSIDIHIDVYAQKPL